MNKKLICVFLLFSTFLFAQTLPTRINDQLRFNSDSRLFYNWNPEKDGYDLKDTEFENSVIDIRQINTQNNGYIVISLTDDGKVRLFHGSIISHNIDDEGISTWVMRSKNARGKLVLNPFKKTFTYSYESNELRYLKIFIFNLVREQEEPKEQ